MRWWERLFIIIGLMLILGMILLAMLMYPK
jgi:hypothetical protein